MSSSGHRLIILNLILIMIFAILSTSHAASIYVKEGKAFYYADKVFLENSQLLKKPIIVQYFGEDSVSIIIADEAAVTENEIHIAAGEQLILDKNGKVSQRLKFQNTVINNVLGIEIPGTYIEGDKVMVNFEGLFQALLIEEGEMGRRKVSLAQRKDFNEETGELHLFDGYSLSLDKDNNLEEQVSFRELAYGGTLKCQIDAESSFAKPQPGYQPAYNPYSTPLPIDSEATFNPKPTILEYEVPIIKKIGVVRFKDQGDITGYTDFIPGFVAKSLGDSVEVIELELSESEESGILLFDRAVRIGKEHDVDAILQGRIRRFESFGAEHEQHYSRDVRMNCEIEASLVDTIGGKYLWKNVAKVRSYTNASEYGRSQKTLLRDMVGKAISNLCEDIKTKNALEGGKQS